MKKYFQILFLISLSWLFIKPASAHIYITDRNITVLLHTNPDDDPIVNQPASMLFEITDKTNRFQVADCDCSVMISRQGQMLLNSPLLTFNTPSIYEFTMPFTFPEKAVYEITFTGKPKTANAFQAFQVQYNLRVDRDAGQAANPQTNTSSDSGLMRKIWIPLGIAAVAICVIIFLYFFRRKK
jgi:hypothetical protein